MKNLFFKFLCLLVLSVMPLGIAGNLYGATTSSTLIAAHGGGGHGGGGHGGGMHMGGGHGGMGHGDRDFHGGRGFYGGGFGDYDYDYYPYYNNNYYDSYPYYYDTGYPYYYDNYGDGAGVYFNFGG